MTDDLTARLRSAAERCADGARLTPGTAAHLLGRAADEIDRLRRHLGLVLTEIASHDDWDPDCPGVLGLVSAWQEREFPWQREFRP